MFSAEHMVLFSSLDPFFSDLMAWFREECRRALSSNDREALTWNRRDFMDERKVMNRPAAFYLACLERRAASNSRESPGLPR